MRNASNTAPLQIILLIQQDTLTPNGVRSKEPNPFWPDLVLNSVSIATQCVGYYTINRLETFAKRFPLQRMIEGQAE